MPIYEYKCKNCGHESEHIEKMSADPTRECEECGGVKARRISRTNFKLVGSGWYATDYKVGHSVDKKTGENTYTNKEGHKWRQEPVD